MKIIGSKDYYDYVANIYGVDPHVVLDRRSGHNIKLSFSNSKIENNRIFWGEAISVCFCGIEYYAICMPNGDIFWGDEIKQLGEFVPSYKRWNNKMSEPVVSIEYQYHYTRNKRVLGNANFKFEPTPTDQNEKENCPILINYAHRATRRGEIKSNKVYSPYPRDLENIKFARVIDADTAYKKLYDWILNRRQDGDFDVLENNEKILAKGFDTRKSFRHRK